MCLRHKIFIPILISLTFGSALNASSFLSSFRKLFSVELSKDLLDSVNKDMLGSLHVKNMRFFLPNRVELDDVEVLDENGKRVLYSKQVQLQVSLLSLLTKNITITNAHIKEPFFNYSVANGIHNVIQVFKSPKPQENKKGDWRVNVSYVQVENGTFEMEHDAKVSIFAQGIKGQGNFWIEDGPFQVDLSQLTIERGAIIAAEMDLPLNNLKAEKITISDEKVSVTTLSAEYKKANLKASGTVFIEKEYYDINAYIDAPRNSYPEGLPRLPFLVPALKAKVMMSGPLTDPDFSISLDSESTEYRGLPIKNGHTEAKLNQHELRVTSANFKIAKDGNLFANGLVDFDKKLLNFSSRQENISSQELAHFLSLKRLSTKGTIYAETKVSGDFSSSKKTELKIATKGKLQKGEIENVILAPNTSFDVQLSFIPNSLIKLSPSVISDDLGLHATIYGDINPENDSLRIKYKLKAGSIGTYLPAIKEDIDLISLQSQGNISQSSKNNFSANGKINSLKAIARNYHANKTSIDFIFQNDSLIIPNLKTELYEGSLSANLTIKEFSKRKLVEGHIIAQGIDLSLATKPLTTLNVAGRASAIIDVHGPLKNFEIKLSGEAERLVLDKFEINSTQFALSYFDGEITVNEWNSIDKSGALSGRDLRFNLKNKKMSGSLYLADGSMAGLFSHYLKYVDGSINGPIHFSGTWTDPEVRAELKARNVNLFGQKLGSGPLLLSLRRDFLLTAPSERDLVIAITTALTESKAQNTLRVAWALNNETLNFHGDIEGLSFDSNLLPQNNSKIALKALLTGNIEIQGPLDKITIMSDFKASEFTIFDPKRRTATDTSKKHGPANLRASLKNGQLNLDLCALFSGSLPEQNCVEKPGISLALKGPFNFSSYELDLRGLIDNQHLEDIILPLKNELATLGASAIINAHLSKKNGQKPKFKAKVKLDKLSASTPTVSHINLEQPIQVELTENSLKLQHAAILNFEPGRLEISGSVDLAKIDMNLNGTMPLMLARFFVPVIQRADGLAIGQLSLKGDTKAPVLTGKIAPERGSLITFNRWLESMEIRGGEIVFQQQSESSYISELKNIKLGVGDGKLAINGVIDTQHATKNRPEKTIFDVQVEGSNIVIKDGIQFVEADFNLRTIKGNAGVPTLSGDAVITDGWISRQFDLRNFVAQAKTSGSGYSSDFLEEIPMDINIDIGVRQFRASARMLNIDIDTILSGQLRVLGRIDHPKITGSLAVMEGKINFPAISFDLYESRIDLNEESDKIFDPIISLSSTQELSKEEFPQLSRDTTIQLELKGNASRLMMELKPIRGDMKLNQTRIFLFLLMPATLGSKSGENQMDVIKRGAQNAAYAFSGEVFVRPLTNELQELLEGPKTRIQFGSAFEPGGISLRMTWKLGSRIEAQGAYWYKTDDSRVLSADSSLEVDNFPLGDLKLKLLLFDHKPFGPLFFEGSFGANRLIGTNSFETRAALRLNYRVLSR